MSDVLLDYAVKISTTTPLPAANNAYLRQVLAVVKPLNEEIEPEVVRCTSKAAVEALTANTDVAALFDSGMSAVYVLPTDSLAIMPIVEAQKKNFFTILISSDFNATEFAGLEIGSFKGVLGYTFADGTAAKEWGKAGNNCALKGLPDNKAKNIFSAFGALLSASTWTNQQYIEMPASDAIDDLGLAETYFNDRVSFVLTSAEYGNRLAFFVCGGKAIIAPYVIEELKLSLQSKGVQFINLNKPQYTVTEATLLEAAEQKVIDDFIERKLIQSGTIRVTLEGENFIASGTAVVPLPTALWRLAVNLIQGEN